MARTRGIGLAKPMMDDMDAKMRARDDMRMMGEVGEMMKDPARMKSMEKMMRDGLDMMEKMKGVGGKAMAPMKGMKGKMK